MVCRSRTDIAAQILEAASGGSTKTKIMYNAFLSYGQLREYLSVLAENGLVHYDQTWGRCKTTAKGHEFIKVYHKMGELVLPEDNQELQIKGKAFFNGV